MKASETTLRPLLDGQKQYIVPFFQRTYAWHLKNWQALWDDIRETASLSGRPHFMGSVVTKHFESTPEGVGRYLIIDGQQRLTTLSLVLAAVRDVAAEVGATDVRDRITRINLTNQLTVEAAKFKLLPTQSDREAYAAILSHGERPACEMTAAYEFFLKKVREAASQEEPIDVKSLEKLLLDSLALVSITLADEDNEYRIFESLNGKGVPLSQADLLRNYFFMRLPLDRHEEMYSTIWLPMQDAVRSARGHDSDLEAFLRYELMSRGKFVRESDVYEEWREDLKTNARDAGAVEAVLRNLARRAEFFRRLIAPSHEPDPDMRDGLTRLNRWGGQTIYPLLLNVYDSMDQGVATLADARTVLRTVESFLVRRMFCRVPTNALNRLFVQIWSQRPADSGIADGVRHVLSEYGKRWPGDDDFVNGVLSYPLYIDSRPEQRKLILETLESSRGFKEAVTDFREYSIEHVMPQGLTEEWRADLGESWEDDYWKNLHVLALLHFKIARCPDVQ